MSDDDFFMEKAFPVGDLLEDDTPLNPDEAPADAIQYLRLVALEASKLDDVVVAKIDERKLKKQTIVYNVEEKPSSSHAPSKEWKTCQVSDFSDLRTRIAKLLMGEIKKPPFELPDRGDEITWCNFCLGSKFAQQVSYEMRGRKKIAKEGESEIEGTPPLLTIICTMNQATVEQLLHFHVAWLESAEGFCTAQGRWLYSLLARLELPLTPDICSLLRTLARACATKRDQVVIQEGSEDLVTALNLLICLVASYFRQLDLEDL